jgi:ATP-dependent Lon protease
MTQDNHNPEAEDQEDENITPTGDEPSEARPIDIKAEPAGDDLDNGDVDIPDTLPILPLRGIVMYPHTAIPLTVGQPRSISLIDAVAGKERLIGLAAAHDPENELPDPDEIHRIGTVATVHRLFRAPDGTIRLLVQGLARIRIDEYTDTEPFLTAKVSAHPEIMDEDSIEIEAMTRNVVDQFNRLAELVPSIPTELISSTLNLDNPLHLVYAIATYIRIDLEQSQELLEIDNVKDKLHRLMQILSKELEVLELGREIQSQAQSEMEKVQREYYLREQLKAIQRELGEVDEQQVEIEEFRRKIDEAGMTEEAEREARRELDRMAKLPTAAAEYGVIRTYLDWLVNVPWNKRTEDNLDIAHARTVLEEDHYGLDDIKTRILEFLAVRKLRADRAETLDDEGHDDYVRRDREGAILCFVGPPGVGKTSLGASIARAMNRKFIRMSLGGVRDEAEIRGFRRTYIGAMPGRIMQTLRRGESRNPVIMLDEVDKLGRDFRGDPASALLEVLDPEQNHEFRDHYIDVAFDLSEVMFITTANELEPIPGPLRDRMEIIRLSGYTEQEKLQIALQYLVPRQVRENGLHPEEIAFADDALYEITRNYTREAGVRELERQIGQVARKIATQVAENSSDNGTEDAITQHQIEAETVRELLGKPRFNYQTEIEDRTDQPGVATGLAYTPMGGDVLFVEAACMPGSKGFQLTGQLGDVMQESARAALSYIRAKATEALNVNEDFFEKNDIHLHVPAGAVPKDGPSAGVTMATALASLLTGRPVKSNVAMTGEITLRGKVLPVGGIKAKVLAAHRGQLDTVILPQRNEQDLDDLPEDVRETMTFILVSTIDEVLTAALLPAVEEESA